MASFNVRAAIAVGLFVASSSFAHSVFAGPTAAAAPEAATSTSAMPPLPPMGESYNCYPVDKEIRPIKVTLNDQFGSHYFTAYGISRFCTPASRRPDWDQPPPAPSANLHYVCYLIKPSKPFTVAATVVVNNVFSNDTLEIRLPTEFCLPSTEKKV